MSEIKHSSIGLETRKVKVEEEAKEVRRKELVERFVLSPFNQAYRMDQLSVWAIWLTVVVSVFLFSTVSVVVLALR